MVDLDYYKTVLETQRLPAILLAELKDLIGEIEKERAENSQPLAVGSDGLLADDKVKVLEKQLTEAMDVLKTIKDAKITELNYDNWLGRLLKDYFDNNADLYS